jgi:hypothetical protein
MDQLQGRLRPYMLWLHKLRLRMERRGFPQTDSLFTAVDEAYGAARDLAMRLHYAGCASGVGQPRRQTGVASGAFQAWANHHGRN